VTQAPLTFDRTTGRLEGATAIERCAILLLQAGALASSPMGHRGFSIGAKVVASLIGPREMVMQLNEDARFAFPLGDGYWSLLLDRRFQYEAEIENFLRGVADVGYTFIDGGANFGLWSVLASSKPYDAHKVVAIEASTATASGWRATPSSTVAALPSCIERLAQSPARASGSPGISTRLCTSMPRPAPTAADRVKAWR